MADPFGDDTWCYKSVDFILNKHIAYDKTNDVILIEYGREYKRYWSIIMSSLNSPSMARRAYAKLESRYFGTPHVIEAVRKAYEILMLGGDGVRVVELSPIKYNRKAGRK